MIRYLLLLLLVFPRFVLRQADPARAAGFVRQYAARYRVPPELIAALIDVESRWNSRAVSSKGAMGLMQLMPATARELNVRNPFDVAQNIDGGVRHFKGLLMNFGGETFREGLKRVVNNHGLFAPSRLCVNPNKRRSRLGASEIGSELTDADSASVIVYLCS